MLEHINNIYAFASIALLSIAVVIVAVIFIKNKGKVKVGNVEVGAGSLEHHAPRTDIRLRTLIERFDTKLNDLTVKINTCLTSLQAINASVMRLQIINDTLPLNDRYEIYEQYHKEGYNGWIDAYVDTFLRPEVERAIKDMKK
jgi:hypothetical protein